MRIYKVNRAYHVVYDSIGEVPSNIQVIEDWREGKLGQWVKTDDGCVIQILRKGVLNSQYSKGKKTKYFGTCTGTYTETMKMTSIRNEDIYTLGGKPSRVHVDKGISELTGKEAMFVSMVAEGVSPTKAYLNIFPTNNQRYASVRSVKLMKTKRVRTAMKKELKPHLKELGIDERYILSGIKSEADTADKADTRLKALFKLSDILDLEDKTTSSVQQITGVQFQGFLPDDVDKAERKALDE